MALISSTSFCAAYKYVIFLWSDDLEQEEFQEVMNQMRNSSYNKSVVRQNYIAASQKDRQEIAEAVKKTEKGDDS